MQERDTLARGERTDLVPLDDSLALFSAAPGWSNPTVRAIVGLRLQGESYKAIAIATSRSYHYVHSVCERTVDATGTPAAQVAHQLMKARIADANYRAAEALAERGAEAEPLAANRLAFAADRAAQVYLDMTEGRRGSKAAGAKSFEVRLVDSRAKEE